MGGWVHVCDWQPNEKQTDREKKKGSEWRNARRLHLFERHAVHYETSLPTNLIVNTETEVSWGKQYW